MKNKTLTDIPLEYMVGVKVYSNCKTKTGLVTSIGNKRNKKYLITIKWSDKKTTKQPLYLLGDLEVI